MDSEHFASHAATVLGPFCIQRILDEDDPASDDRWRVTHVRSGQTAGAWPTRELAEQFALALRELPVAWDTDRPTVPQALMPVVDAIREAVCLGFGQTLWRTIRDLGLSRPERSDDRPAACLSGTVPESRAVITDNSVANAVKELAHLGLLENSWQRRPDQTGQLQVVWRLSPLGERVAEYERLGLTFDHALAKAKATSEDLVN